MLNNKSILIIIVVIIFSFLISIITLKSFNKNEKIVFVDLQKAYNDFKMNAEIEKEAQGLFQKRQLLLDSLLNDLKTKEKVANKSKNKGSKENLEKDKEFYFQKKQYFDNSNQQIIEQYKSKIWETIQTLSNEFANENEIDMILGKGAAQAFVYGNEKFDYTNSFIEYLNKHYSEKK
ncbi:MAG: OmpH family outer membrane protein [Bacteroidetes bacterium]|nr:OmpH family outer membrane protein [Bacteroidota bacterium]